VHARGEAVVLDVARSRDHDVLRLVPALVPRAELGLREALDRHRVADRAAAERVVPVQDTLKQDVDRGLVVVLEGGDLVEDASALELDPVEARVLRDVGKRLERRVESGCERVGAILGGLLRGRPAGVGADVVEEAGEGSRRPRRRAAEKEQVLEEVRYPALAVALVDRAYPHPHADRRRRRPPPDGRDHAQAGIERRRPGGLELAHEPRMTDRGRIPPVSSPPVLWTPVDPGDARLRSGLEQMMEARARAVGTGERPVGWKIGWNVPAVRERLGIGSSVIGFMLESGIHDASDPISLDGTSSPGAEVELAIHVGEDASIAAASPGIELVDVHGRFDDVEGSLAANIWHRGLVIGRRADWDDALLDEIEVRIEHNGEPFEEPVRPRVAIEDADALVEFVAETAASLGAPLREGDVILSGLLVPSPVWTKPGDRMSADYGRLGRLELEFRA
jgi:2-keto-4-pentenoate hydratase